MNFSHRRWQVVLLVLAGAVVAFGLVAVGSSAVNRQASSTHGDSDATLSTNQSFVGIINSTSPTRDIGWRSRRANPANTKYLDSTGPTSPINTRWTFTFDNRHSNWFTTRPVVVNGTVYIVAQHGDGRPSKLYAIDAWTGEKRWTYKGTGEQRIREVTAYRDTVYIGMPEEGVYALNAATGDKRWEFDTSGNVNSIKFADRTLYVSTSNGGLYARRALTGEAKWTFTPAKSAPAIVNGTVYVTGGGGKTLALDAKTGAERWHTKLDNKSYRISAPAVANGQVYVANNNNKDRGIIYALDAASGTKHWTYERPGKVGAPAVVNETAIFGIKNEGTFALNTNTGETRWHIDSPSGTPALVNGMAYINTNYGVYAFDPATGDKRAEFRFEEKNASASLGLNSRSGVAVLKGSLYTGVGIGHQAFGTYDTLKFVALGTPEFTYSNRSVTPESPDPGESVTVTATVANTGTGPGQFNATFTIDGKVVNTTGGRLDAGASRTVTFTYVFETGGAYTVGIGGKTRNIGVGDATPAPTPTRTATPTVTTTTTATGEQPTATTTTTSTPGFGPGVWLVAFAVLAWFVGSRK